MSNYNDLGNPLFYSYFFQVQYCCETCRDLSWNEYHAFECGILACLEPSRYLGKMPHLALRYVNNMIRNRLLQNLKKKPSPSFQNHHQDRNAKSDPTFNVRKVAPYQPKKWK